MIRRAIYSSAAPILQPLDAQDTIVALRADVAMLTRELESATSELRAMNEELQSMVGDGIPSPPELSSRA